VYYSESSRKTVVISGFSDHNGNPIDRTKWTNFTWIIPRNFYQGCFDFALVKSIDGNKIKLMIFQVTVSKKHSLKLHLVHTMRAALVDEGFEIDGEVGIVGIVPKDNFEVYQFQQPIETLQTIPLRTHAGYINEIFTHLGV